MDPAQALGKDNPASSWSSPSQSSHDKQAHIELHGANSVTNSNDERFYGSIPTEEPYGLRNERAMSVPYSKERTLKRRASRFGLSGLFGRSRLTDHNRPQERLGTQMEMNEAAGEPDVRKDIVPRSLEPSTSEEVESFLMPEALSTQPRSKSSKPSLKAKSSFKKATNVKTWDPPPLFQAYPQAVKHATLQAPSLSAESIVRLNAERTPGTHAPADPYLSDSAMASKEKKIRRHNGVIEWTQKIYILVTAGYLLQFSGDGPYDRLPEKIMPLTTESAAFASDAIHGRPFVMQVSQVSDDRGTLDKDASKSMLKKLGLRNVMRRSTSTFLLVLASPEELSSWLEAVRREIQALGGRELRSDEPLKYTTEGLIQQIQPRPSQRYLVKRDPNRFTEKIPDHPSEGDDNKAEALEAADHNSTVATKRQSLATQNSLGSRSASNTTASINQIYLDRLRESPGQSYTTSTSQGSSPRLCPNETNSEIPDLSREFADNPTWSGSARASMDKAPKTNLAQRMSMFASSPQQSIDSTPQHRRTSSPTAPNFSVPTFSKRYSTSPGLIPTREKAQTPPIAPHREPPSPPPLEKGDGVSERRISTVGQLQDLRKPSPHTARKCGSVEIDSLLTPPPSSGSCNPPSSSDSDNRGPRRFSSLEYSRGVSPLQLARQSPSPHPPPTAALPPLPPAALQHRASLIPPPTTALPPIPCAPKAPSRHSVVPPPISSPSVNSVAGSSCISDSSPTQKGFSEAESSANTTITGTPVNVANSARGTETNLRPSLNHNPPRGFAERELVGSRMSCRPAGLGLQEAMVADQPSLGSPLIGLKTKFDLGRLTPPLEDSPQPPSRQAVRPSAQLSRIEERPDKVRTGREPPPVSTPVSGPRPRITVSSRAESYFDGAAPHPFIPPIRVSERKFRGSLDGPWNPSYGGPQRTFFDLSVG